MPSYLRFTPPTLEVPLVRPRLTVLVALGCLAGGGGAGPGTRAPQPAQETLAQFMSAVKDNNIERMGTLWGSERGPATSWMKSDQLRERLSVVQKYVDHAGYRVIEGPLAVPGHDNLKSFRVELQRQGGCTVVFPVDLVRTKSGGWVVNDVHLGSIHTPGTACRRWVRGARAARPGRRRRTRGQSSRRRPSRGAPAGGRGRLGRSRGRRRWMERRCRRERRGRVTRS